MQTERKRTQPPRTYTIIYVMYITRLLLLDFYNYYSLFILSIILKTKIKTLKVNISYKECKFHRNFCIHEKKKKKY